MIYASKSNKNDERYLRECIEQNFISPAGTRSLVPKWKITDTLKIESALQYLVECYIIIEADTSTGSYELTHDLFLDAIMTSNLNWNSKIDFFSELEKQARNFALERITRKLRDTFQFESSKEERDEDWVNAKLSLCSDILDGKINFNNISQNLYCELENVFLKNIKEFRAYFVWKNKFNGIHCRTKEDMEKDYDITSESIRKNLINGKRSSIEEFEKVQEYLEKNYLDNGSVNDKEKHGAEQLIRGKSERLFRTTKNENEDENWFRAKLYTRMYYENIIPAVTKNDINKTAMILKAFQFSKSKQNSYYIVNCFEVAVAINFLNKKIIKKIMDDPQNYDFSMIQVLDWPKNIKILSGYNKSFKYDEDDHQIIYYGKMDSKIYDYLLFKISNEDHKQAVHKLYTQSLMEPHERMIL